MRESVVGVDLRGQSKFALRTLPVPIVPELNPTEDSTSFHQLPVNTQRFKRRLPRLRERLPRRNVTCNWQLLITIGKRRVGNGILRVFTNGLLQESNRFHD